METSRVEKRGLSDAEEMKSFDPILVKVDKYGEGPHIIHIDKDEFKIGRARENDEIILNTMISRKHCVIRCEGNSEWSIKDCSSTSTFVNDMPIPTGHKHCLSVGDVIQFSTSDDFKYIFTTSMREERERKRQKLDEHWIDAAMMEQKTFSENQACQKRELQDQLQTKQKEQAELKKQLEELLKQSVHTSENDKGELLEQIKSVETQITAGTVREQYLQSIYKKLLELENETVQFEARFNREKQKWQEALDMSKQEKDELEAKMKQETESWRKQQQEEWKNVMESRVKEEKDIQAQLLNEKTKLEEKLKETERALREQEAKAENLQTVQNNEVLDIKDDQDMHIIDTIDLTECGEIELNTDTKEDSTLYKVGTIMDEQLTCSVCAELFIKATTLNCTHTFCQHCIKSWNKKRKECPVCRASVTSMNRSLVLDNFIESMMENLPTQFKAKRKEIVAERKLLERKKKVR